MKNQNAFSGLLAHFANLEIKNVEKIKGGDDDIIIEDMNSI